MGDRILSHRDLLVWQKSVDTVDLIYTLTEGWPKHEMYGLTSQLRRASVSVPSNIAEGNGRGSIPDYIRFLYLAYGSLMEVDTQIFIGLRRGYIAPEQEAELMSRVSEIGKMMNGLIRSLRKKNNN